MNNGYIYIKLTNKCNTLCNFCADDWIKRRAPDPSLEEIKNTILKEYNSGYKSLIITGGEPTLSPILLDVLTFAKKIGIQMIQLVTNGRLLSIPRFLDKIDPFVDRYQISLFSSDPYTFDKMCNANGAFIQVIEAMKLLFIRRKNVMVNCVITKDNLEELDKILILAYSLNVSYFQYSFLKPMAFAYENCVYLKYSQIMPKILKVIELKEMKLKNISLGFDNFPACVFPNIEKQIQYISDLKRPLKNKKTYQEFKVKTEKCAKCKYFEYCEGLEKSYYQLFGDEELKPILT